MLKITMVRHGRTEGNSLGKYIGVTDEHILPEEREALKALAFPLAEQVYISPMKRCRETAEAIYPNSRPVVIEELAECDFGYFEGKTYQELAGDPEYKSWVSGNEVKSFPGGENRFDFQTRCINGFTNVVRDAAKKGFTSVAMVVHGGTIMSILDAYGFPSQPYVKWMVENGEGYQVRLNPDVFLDGSSREVIVDGKIVRSSL